MTAPDGLRATLKAAGGSMQSVTVLAACNDPFRCDTPAGHRDGAWLANTLERLGIRGQRHLRGLHYILIGQPKPNGLPYTNTDDDWHWLANDVAKPARWLGYVPFDRIVDQRNDEPVIRKWSPPNPWPYISVNYQVTVPDYDDLTPWAGVDEFTGSQPYHLVLVGEKSSLRPVLADLAERFKADLYLPTGEISDTQLHGMAKSGVADGRPMVVFYFGDCDPAGWQMPISVARKLQALKVIEFDGLDFQVHRVGLTPDQVKMYGLPSTPLKDTEKRADKWTAAMGVAQTEIDALAALQPDLLLEIAETAIGPFFDHTLDDRVRRAYRQWQEQAQQILDADTGGDFDVLRADAAAQLAAKRDEIQAILDTVRVDAASFAFPTPVVPEAQLGEEQVPAALCDSVWSFAEQCHRLIASKRYNSSEEVA